MDIPRKILHPKGPLGHPNRRAQEVRRGDGELWYPAKIVLLDDNVRQLERHGF